MVSENAKNAYADVVKSIQLLSTEEKKNLVVRLQNHIKYEIFGNCPDTKKRCPKCGCERYCKNGRTEKGTQKYKCAECGSTFTLYSGRILKFTLLPMEKWLAFAECFVDCLSCDKTAAKIHVTHRTAWYMRIRVLESFFLNLPSFEVKEGCGAVLDETYFAESFKGVSFKNLGRMPREPRNNGVSSKRGISDEKICVMTGVNDCGEMFYDVACRGYMTINVAENVLNDKICENAVIDTDNHHSYSSILSNLCAKHNVHNAKDHDKELTPINKLHSQIKDVINCKFKGVSTKWLPYYLCYVKWLREFGKSDKSLDSIAVEQIKTGNYQHRWCDINTIPLPFRDKDLKPIKISC